MFDKQRSTRSRQTMIALSLVLGWALTLLAAARAMGLT